MRLMSFFVPVAFLMAGVYVTTVESQFYPTTPRYASALYAGQNLYGQLPHSSPVHYPHANPAQYDRHRRYYDPSNTQPCSHYFCFRLDFAFLSVIRPEDRPPVNSTASGPCSSAQVFVCAADPVVSKSYGTAHTPNYAPNYPPPNYAAITNCPAFVCNANFTNIVTGCDAMNCTAIGSHPLLF